ncbi:hypothetical protein N7510_004646 [Penicillium lagena]|uniref:uncharacterized protein n=1 Tax=Penicillium lagena TaxID=94218 RepID=UPI0025407555|nr:uncharacterized protein N7510_004646 [Penicillium lagena]KAJ5620662.1 hypothetical protein N7510_004646 [Penicillium lagena]
MDDADSRNAALASVDGLSTRSRSGSAGSAGSSHKRTLSGSLLSKLSFLRMSQATKPTPHSQHPDMEQDADGEDLKSSLLQTTGEGLTGRAGGKAMSAVQQQQQRRTRRRRGSLRKTALLGTRLEMREKRAVSTKANDALKEDSFRPHTDSQQSARAKASPDAEPTPRGSFDDEGDESQPSWFRVNAQQKALRPSIARRRQSLSRQSLSKRHDMGDETGTDEEDLVTFPRISTANNSSTVPVGNSSIRTGAASLHIPTASSGSESYYPLRPDTAYRPVHRTKSSPLATHSVEMKSSSDIARDYSETEWWGWIILMVTWLVFVVGIGSCFEVWSWAWDVGETPTHHRSWKMIRPCPLSATIRL